MAKYEYGLIDAQYVLIRNKSAQVGWSENGVIDKNQLLKVCIQSFMKLKRDWDFKYGILLWDRKPYIKASNLPDYKGDRWIPTEEEKDEWQKVVDNPDSTPEQIEEAKNNIKYIENEFTNFEVMQDVKYTLVNKFNPMGFKSILIEGFEADDLAYLTSCYLDSNNITGVLLTSDRDWVNFSNKNVEYWSTKTYDNYPELVEERNKYMDIPGINEYLYGILSEIYSGSHNNVPEYEYDIDFRTFCTKLLSGDTSLPDYEVRKMYLDSMDIRKYWEVIKDTVINVLYDNSCKPGLLTKYMQDNYFSINFSRYMEYVSDYVQL